MSRAPTPAKASIWKEIDEATERFGFPLLVTADPEKDPVGQPAWFYRRRVQRGGKWQLLADWAGVTSRMSLDPQPTHWRPDPNRGKLDPERSVPEKATA